MNKRKKIKKLKKEIRIVYSHNKRFLDKLVAVELALNPDSQICDITSPSTAKRVAELVAENKRLKSASVPTDVKCGKCHGLVWLFWDELANYNGPAPIRNSDDTRYECDMCNGSGNHG